MNGKPQTPAGRLLAEQLRMLRRIRICAEIWSLIGVLVLLGWCAACILGLSVSDLLAGMWAALTAPVAP